MDTGSLRRALFFGNGHRWPDRTAGIPGTARLFNYQSNIPTRHAGIVTLFSAIV